MRYVSTRGDAPILPFDDVLLTGLARDGGLYVPDAWPTFPAGFVDSLRGRPYAEVAARVLAPFVGGALADDDLAAILADSYAGFDHPEVAPLSELSPGLHMLELFHGPTLAFKDYALQVLGRLFDHVLKERGERITIVGATSGDTGSAAIEACRDRDAIDIFILHPEGRVSEVQRRQMTTVVAANVHNIAIRGTFDDCQDLVKTLFNDLAFRDRYALSAVNSINWARIVAQVVYYYWAAAHLDSDGRPLTFAVPTGNFGNIFAGWVARRTGLPIATLVCGSNRNDILTRFFDTGRMEIGDVHPTISPSMDIQISSNFERLLFELEGRDGARVASLMTGFRKTGAFAVSAESLEQARALFAASRFDDDRTRATIRAVHRETGRLIDPHSAVGVAAARAARASPKTPVVALATAHPAKFPDAVEEATGVRPALPPHLADLMQREERLTSLPNDLETVKAFVAGAARR